MVKSSYEWNISRVWRKETNDWSYHAQFKKTGNKRSFEIEIIEPNLNIQGGLLMAADGYFKKKQNIALQLLG